MKNCFITACLLAIAMTFGTSFAQDEAQKPNYVYATYFVCSPDRESRADEIMNSSYKPHYDAAVENGDILGWSWLQHFVGGSWRRVLVIIAADMNLLLDASGALGEIISDQSPEAGRAFSEICASHEDYIWETEPGLGTAAVTDTRGAAGFSVYFRCDLNGEEKADRLVKDVIGPVYNRHVGAGQLTSWNWLKHNVGGEYRRLLIMSAADHKTVMKTRAAMLAEFQERKVARAMTEFNEICSSHDDYMWDILIQ
ncbi:MAG: hypothetical protein HKN64_01030 [Woeseiaceae bacterium]|nr:hypothetical protein [Woeseiaceae bacterium]